MKIVLASIVLIEMILYVPVNSYGHIGTLPPFYGYGTSVHPETASNLTPGFNHPSKPLRLILMSGLN